MIQTNTEILEEALEDIDELIEYMLSESGDPNPPPESKDSCRLRQT